MRSPERHLIAPGGWPPPKLLRSFDSPQGGSDPKRSPIHHSPFRGSQIREANLVGVRPGRRSRQEAQLLEGRGQAFTKRSFVRSPERHRAALGGWTNGSTRARASVYEAKLRAQPRATPSCARWLECRDWDCSQSMKSRQGRQARLISMRSPTESDQGRHGTPMICGAERVGVPDLLCAVLTPPKGGVIQSAAPYITPPSGGVRIAERIWWG